MSANGQTVSADTTEVTDKGKGKGKAVEQPDVIEQDEESEEESAAEEVQYCCAGRFRSELTILLVTAT